MAGVFDKGLPIGQNLRTRVPEHTDRDMPYARRGLDKRVGAEE